MQTKPRIKISAKMRHPLRGPHGRLLKSPYPILAPETSIKLKVCMKHRPEPGLSSLGAGSIASRVLTVAHPRHWPSRPGLVL